MDAWPQFTIDDLLAAARTGMARISPDPLAGEQTAGALVVDIRPIEQRHRDGDRPVALVIDRNVLGSGLPHPVLIVWSISRMSGR